ncbi:VWA domain-containing protein [Desulfococcus sp.]|uniref:vWA domain-containing protein n=1 Tax=Desulfococcus sp. TaxID=2025834 RepID=UPI00359439CC
MDIANPAALTLLAAIPALLVLKRAWTRPTGFSLVAMVDRDLRPGPVKRFGPDILDGAVVLLLVLAIANPRYAVTRETTRLESRWIMLVQDLSGSMNRPSDVPGKTLGDVSREALRSFIGLRRERDLIGLMAFSSHAKLVCPPTFDREILAEKLSMLDRRSDSAVFRELTAGGATNASYAAWLALSSFFMLLPRENQPTFAELRDFRHGLSGRTLETVPVPARLGGIGFGRGMAIVLFTDGRIEANAGPADAAAGLPNFVNVARLIRKLGVRLYLVVTGDRVDDEVARAVAGPDGGAAGRLFFMPRTADAERIGRVFQTIHDMEKNRLLATVEHKRREARPVLAAMAAAALIASWAVRIAPATGRV